MIDVSVMSDQVALDDTGPVPLLAVDGLHTTFGRGPSRVDAVRGVSFALRRGETLVLLGESGSGKSVTARSLMQLYDRSASHRGHVRLDGQDLMGSSEAELRRIRGKRIALVSQDPGAALDPLRRVGRQMDEALRIHLPLERAERRERVVDLLRLMGLPQPDQVARSFPHELSGGMRQRVAIALAVSCDPELLIADEPTTALDVTVQAQILEELDKLKKRMKMAVLLVTHDVGVAAQMADQVAVMYAGRIIEIGPARAVLDHPAHPYTKGLLSCLPAPGMTRGSLQPLPGTPPMAGENPSGCPFAPRCSRAHDACIEIEPDLRPVTAHHSSGCLLVPELEESPA
jgi:oligopeptide/dipeptide ABC transporter ATP-binding protein